MTSPTHCVRIIAVKSPFPPYDDSKARVLSRKNTFFFHFITIPTSCTLHHNRAAPRMSSWHTVRARDRRAKPTRHDKDEDAVVRMLIVLDVSWWNLCSVQYSSIVRNVHTRSGLDWWKLHFSEIKNVQLKTKVAEFECCSHTRAVEENVTLDELSSLHLKW